MNPFEMVVLIVFIAVLGRVLLRFAERRGETGDEARRQYQERGRRLQALEERVAVLERIVTDQGYELKQKFRDL